MNNKTVIGSLSMDLLRVAIGYHRGSNKMAKRFSEEALKRVSEIDSKQIKPNFVKILNKLPAALSNDDVSRISEDALMYSTLCKNYIKHNY